MFMLSEICIYKVYLYHKKSTFQNSYAKRLSSVHFLHNKKIYFYVTQRYIFYAIKKSTFSFFYAKRLKNVHLKKCMSSKKNFFRISTLSI